MTRVLETERLYLDEVLLEDAGFVFELMNSPGWLQFIGERGIKTNEDAEQYIQEKFIKSYIENGYGLYKMVLQETNSPLGLCGLVNRPGLDFPDIGFAILPQYERQGYCSEASFAVLDQAFNTLHLPTVLAITDKDNIASQNLLLKIGLKEKGKVKLSEDAQEELLLFTIENKL